MIPNSASGGPWRNRFFQRPAGASGTYFESAGEADFMMKINGI
jgi:hypothetical protein